MPTRSTCSARSTSPASAPTRTAAAPDGFSSLRQTAWSPCGIRPGDNARDGREPERRRGAPLWLQRAADLGDHVARELVRRDALPMEFRPLAALPDEELRASALRSAAARDDLATLAALLDPVRVDSPDAFGRTALHYAAEAGAVGAVAALLAGHARTDVADQYGITPLMLACGAEQPAACTLLLQAGASVTAADRGGNSALVHALQRGRTQQAQDLLAAGATPVRLVAVTGTPAVADSGARGAVDAYAGWPDVVVAASRRDPAMLREVLRRGADPNATTPAGETALFVAVAADAPQSVELLLQAGADASRKAPAARRRSTPRSAWVARPRWPRSSRMG